MSELGNRFRQLHPEHPANADKPLGAPRRTAHHTWGFGKFLLHVLETPAIAVKIGAETVTHAIGGGVKGTFKGGGISLLGEGALVGGSQALNHLYPTVIAGFPNAAEVASVPIALLVTAGFAVTGVAKSVFRYWRSEFEKERAKVEEGLSHGDQAIQSAKATHKWWGDRRQKAPKEE